MPFLSVEKVSYSYAAKSGAVRVLHELSFQLGKGDFAALQGRSGSGKSTLFYLLGCLLRPESGRILLEGADLTALPKDELAFLRNQKIGFIFQQFHLLPRATVLENILLGTLYPVELKRDQALEVKKAVALATRLGLGTKLGRRPNELSGGEQQRVAIARALMNDPPLLLADEPTGNLDSATAKNLLDLFHELNQEGKTFLLITHDDEIARQCSTIFRLQDGKLVGTESSLPLSRRPLPQATSAFLRPARATPWGWRLKLARAALPVAFKNLARNKLRAFLTILGVTVGIASVFAMVTFGTFARDKILQGYQDLGANSVIIRGYENWRRQATEKVDVLFTAFDWEKDVLPLKRIFPEMALLSPVLRSWNVSAHFAGSTLANEVIAYGVNAAYLPILNRTLSQGRNLTPYHVESRSPVCLIGSEIKDRLFVQAGAIGKILFITSHEQSYPCQVIGVLEPQSSSREWSKPNLHLLMPYTYFQSVNPSWKSELHEFIGQLYPGSDVERTGKGVKAYFQQKYGRSGRFQVDSDTLLLAQMKKFLSLFAVLLTVIALVTLGVGGVGITNLMLVSVSERLKEIGLRKAVGATDRSIRVQFLLEAFVLSAIAGILGVVVGFAAYETVIYLSSKLVTTLTFEWVWEPVALLFSLLSVVVVGILGGIVPALKAERLEVIQALRSE